MYIRTRILVVKLSSPFLRFCVQLDHVSNKNYFWSWWDCIYYYISWYDVSNFPCMRIFFLPFYSTNISFLIMNSDHCFCVQYASGKISSIMVWDLDREQLACSILSSIESCISALVSLSDPYAYFMEVFKWSFKF